MAPDYNDNGMAQGSSLGGDGADFGGDADALDIYGVWVKSGPRDSSEEETAGFPAENGADGEALDAGPGGLGLDAGDAFGAALPDEGAGQGGGDAPSENPAKDEEGFESVDMSFFDETERDASREDSGACGSAESDEANAEEFGFEDIDFDHLVFDGEISGSGAGPLDLGIASGSEQEPPAPSFGENAESGGEEEIDLSQFLDGLEGSGQEEEAASFSLEPYAEDSKGDAGIFESDEPLDIDIEFDDGPAEGGEAQPDPVPSGQEAQALGGNSGLGFVDESIDDLIGELMPGENEEGEEGGDVVTVGDILGGDGALSNIEETSEFDDFLASLESSPPPADVQEAIAKTANEGDAPPAPYGCEDGEPGLDPQEEMPKEEAQDASLGIPQSVDFSGAGLYTPQEKDLLFDDIGAFEKELEDAELESSAQKPKSTSEEEMNERSNEILLAIVEELAAIKRELATLKDSIVRHNAPSMPFMPEAANGGERAAEDRHAEEMASTITEDELDALMTPSFDDSANTEDGLADALDGLDMQHITSIHDDDNTDYLVASDGDIVDFGDAAMESENAISIYLDHEKLKEPELKDFSVAIDEISASIEAKEKEDEKQPADSIGEPPAGQEEPAEGAEAPEAEIEESPAGEEGDGTSAAAFGLPGEDEASEGPAEGAEAPADEENSELLNLVFEMPPDEDDEDLSISFYEAALDEPEESIIEIPDAAGDASSEGAPAKEDAAPIAEEGKASLERDAEAAIGEATGSDVAQSQAQEPPATDTLPTDLKEEIKSVLLYMDQLLDNLPEEKIEEFARSKHFEVYKKLFEELGIS